MQKLDEELENMDLDDITKENIINIYNSYMTVKNNHIYIENDHHDFIAIGRGIMMNNQKKNNIVDATKTIFLSNCSDIKIILGKKINHVIIEKCNNIAIRIMRGLISGIDIINSNNINLVIDDNNIYNLNCGKSNDCQCLIKSNIAVKTLISTLDCHNISLSINDPENRSNILFKTNESLFSGDMGLILYKFDEYNTRLLYSTNDQTGEIYPI
jgi:hypothetical protein